MPRPALSKVSTSALQAEIERRVSKLADLLKLRNDVDRQIDDLKALAGQLGQAVAAPAPVAEQPKRIVRKRRRRNAKTAQVVAMPVADTEGKPVLDKQTASEFVLGLLAGGKTLTSQEMAKASAAAGRKGTVENALSVLVKAGKLKRRKIRGGRGSNYRLAGPVGRPAKAVAAKPVAETGKPGQSTAEFILGLFSGGKTLATAELARAWAMSGRGGKVDTPLSRLVEAKKLARRKMRGQRGSQYSLAGSAGVQAEAVSVKPLAKPAAMKPGRNGQTAGAFILDLLKGKTLTGGQVNEAWKKAGRSGRVDTQLSVLTKAGKINRKPLVGKPGSNYSLA